MRTAPIHRRVRSMLLPSGSIHGAESSVRETQAGLFRFRARSIPRSYGVLQSAKSPFAFAVIAQGFAERFGLELGPALRRHPQLGVGDLPQQKVADAHLARRANQEIGLRHACRAEIISERRFVDGVRIE